jgi:hypothetical protein
VYLYFSLHYPCVVTDFVLTFCLYSPQRKNLCLLHSRYLFFPIVYLFCTALQFQLWQIILSSSHFSLVLFTSLLSGFLSKMFLAIPVWSILVTHPNHSHLLLIFATRWEFLCNFVSLWLILILQTYCSSNRFLFVLWCWSLPTCLCNIGSVRMVLSLLHLFLLLDSVLIRCNYLGSLQVILAKLTNRGRYVAMGNLTGLVSIRIRVKMLEFANKQGIDSPWC